MNILQLVLASIGAVVVIGCFIIAIGAAWLAWQVWKCERDEARAWQQERALRERDEAQACDNARPYPPGGKA
ncbi:MAG: hypothetical protein IMZ54_07770 [Acidobacteria bacterium]|nr:hypothetical protein [Acidobacteriota bacterium]